MFVACSWFDSPPHLLWVPTETLGRALRGCQLVLEGGPLPDSNQIFFQSALHTTVRILDSIVYLTSIHTLSRYTQFIFNSSHVLFFNNKSFLLVMCAESSQSEDGLQRRVCALLSLPWLCENKSSSEYRSASFPSWVPALSQRLACCYCEYMHYITMCTKIQIFL